MLSTPYHPLHLPIVCSLWFVSVRTIGVLGHMHPQPIFCITTILQYFYVNIGCTSCSFILRRHCHDISNQIYPGRGLRATIWGCVCAQSARQPDYGHPCAGRGAEDQPDAATSMVSEALHHGSVYAADVFVIPQHVHYFNSCGQGLPFTSVGCVMLSTQHHLQPPNLCSVWFECVGTIGVLGHTHPQPISLITIILQCFLFSLSVEYQFFF